MDQPPASSSFNTADLAHLPLDLLQPILFSPILLRQDVKSVRLTCRLLAHKAASVLFYRIRISSLKTDRDAFFSIAGSAHLCCHVHILVWEELNGDHGKFNPRHRPGHWATQPDDDWTLLINGLLPQMESLFWLKSESVDFDKQATIDAFLPQFQAAVVNMFNLHTLVSKPMHAERLLKGAEVEYPITARIIKGFIHQDVENCVFNEGFTAVLMPTLQHLATHPGPRVTRLLFADETVTKATALTRLTHENASVFSTLQHLDFCIGGSLTDEENLHGWVSCLREASHLSHLHICQESVGKYDRKIYMSLLRLIPTLPKLSEVHLDDIAVHDSLPGSPFVDFMSRHASTLRKVYIATTNITTDNLVQLAKLKSLHLDRLVLIPNQAVEQDDPWPTNEQAILDFVNQRFGSHTPRNIRLARLDNSGDIPYAAEGWSQRGYESWEVMALDKEADEWRDEDGFTYEIGPCRVYDPPTGLWVDREGIWYNPRTDEEMIEPERRNYDNEDESWARGQRVWNWELGLWTVEAADTKITYYKFAVDRAGIHGSISRSDDDTISQDDCDMQPHYRKEDDAHILRKRGCPRWDWGRDPVGNIWYWEAMGNGEGYTTEMWRFDHRDGQQAYGDDPLEFWSNWEGSEAGDKAEPTPYGWRFRSFIENWPRAGPGGDLLSNRGRKKPVLYSPDDDPMVPLEADSHHPAPPEFEVDDLSDMWNPEYME